MLEPAMSAKESQIAVEPDREMQRLEKAIRRLEHACCNVSSEVNSRLADLLPHDLYTEPPDSSPKTDAGGLIAALLQSCSDAEAQLDTVLQNIAKL